MNFWDNRYSSDEYAYGITANEYFRRRISKMRPGKLLHPAEGEGRNAVYAAAEGWEVTAFDQSIKAREKALALASQKNVRINYLSAGFDDIVLPEEHFDCVALIFAHMPEEKRPVWHLKISRFLKKNGILILEAFSKAQLNYHSGGPKEPDLLFSKKSILADFSSFAAITAEEHITELSEGKYHKGKASLIRASGIK
ncbi:MAG: class I SAM-dependent methyltransferase [Bacteroidota bacterium]